MIKCQAFKIKYGSTVWLQQVKVFLISVRLMPRCHDTLIKHLVGVNLEKQHRIGLNPTLNS